MPRLRQHILALFIHLKLSLSWNIRRTFLYLLCILPSWHNNVREYRYAYGTVESLTGKLFADKELDV